MAMPELVQLKVKVPKELRRQLKAFAAETGKSMNELVTQAIASSLPRRVVVQIKGAK